MLFENIATAYTVVNILIAVILNYKLRHSLTNRFYLFCVIFLSALGVIAQTSKQHVHLITTLVFVDVSVFLYSLFPFFFLHFIIIFVRNYEVLKSKNVIVAIYAVGLLSYTSVLLGYLPQPISEAGEITHSGFTFYLTWMSLLFTVGIALLYEMTKGFYGHVEKTKFLFGSFVVLVLVMPGPFTESLFFRIFNLDPGWYFFTSVAALTATVYLIFRHKVIVSTIYESLKNALSVMQDIFLKTNKDFEIQMARGAVGLQLGYTEQELVGRSLREFINPHEHLDTYLGFAQRGETKESYFDADVMVKDGTRIPMNFSFSAMYVDRQLDGFVAIGRNIKDKKEAENELLRHRNNLEKLVEERSLQIRLQADEMRALIASMDDVILVLDKDGRYVKIAPTNPNLLYKSAEELIGKKVEDVFPQEQAMFFLKHINEALEKRHTISVEYCLKIGENEVWFLGNISPMTKDSVLWIARDITGRKKLEDQLRHSQKMEGLGTLAGGVAHDFNNILSIVMGYASLLERNKINPAKLAETYTIIRRSTERGAGLVRQLLTFARKADIRLESMRVNDIVTETSKLLQETFPKTILIELHLEKNLPLIYADPNQMNQVLINLCVNARDAMPNGGTLMLTTMRTSGKLLSEKFPQATSVEYVQVDVADTGMGIPQETLRRIFEPFFTTKELGRGTGLGLAVVFGIIESHHGVIDVESKQGKGTMFHLYFPVDQRKSENISQKKNAATEIVGGTETILFVEDEEMLSDLIKSILEKQGYTVLTADDGEKMINIYSQFQSSIKLVLTDLGLPKIDGFEAFKKIKILNPAVKVVFASGYLDPDLKSEILKAGAKDFVQKPYDTDEILRKVREILDQKA